MGRFLTVCIYQKAATSRQAAFGKMQNASRWQQLGGFLPFNLGPLHLAFGLIADLRTLVGQADVVAVGLLPLKWSL